MTSIFGKQPFRSVKLFRRNRRNTDKVEVIKKRFKLHKEQSQPNDTKLKEIGFLIEVNSIN